MWSLNLTGFKVFTTKIVYFFLHKVSSHFNNQHLFWYLKYKYENNMKILFWACLSCFKINKKSFNLFIVNYLVYFYLYVTSIVSLSRHLASFSGPPIRLIKITDIYF